MSDFVAFASGKSPHSLSAEEILAWAGAIDNWAFYNTVALDIARGYYRGELSYTFCDGLMNDLWFTVTVGLKNGEMVPYPFFEIFEAFDAGEFHRKADRSDDPVADFTDPAISDIALRYNF